MTLSEDVHAGQAVYNRFVLAAYDSFVLGLSCRWAWRCPKEHMLATYNRNTGRRHLEIGVGTGYFTDRCAFPAGPPAITLLDLNPTVLRVGAARVSRYHPQSVQADALQPLPLPADQLNSVGMKFLPHCLPGDWSQKGSALEHAATVVRPDGTVFGSTILGLGVRANPFARTLMKVYNRKGIFHNNADDQAGLEEQLARCFGEHQVTVHGMVALFEARHPLPRA